MATDRDPLAKLQREAASFLAQLNAVTEAFRPLAALAWATEPFEGLAERLQPLHESAAAAALAFNFDHLLADSIFDSVSPLHEAMKNLSPLPIAPELTSLAQSASALMEQIKLTEIPRYTLPPTLLEPLPRVALRSNFEETMRRIVREEIERATAEQGGESDGPKYGSDGVKRRIGFEREGD